MNRIYYFSSTGNTLAAAREFAQRLKDTEILSIADLDRAESVDFSDVDTIGIFFPVYCFGLPAIVRRFVLRVQSNPKLTPYVYSLCTCGGMKGAAAYVLEDLLKEKNIRLSLSFSLVMPSNYIPRSVPPTENRMEKLFAKASSDIEEAVLAVKERRTEELLHVFPFDVFGDIIAQRAVSYLSNYDRYFWVTEQCDSCGLCEKICPESNVIIMNGIPTWHGHCEHCMGCLQWCPQEAIQFRKVTLKRKRYHHPAIQADDMILKICR